MIAIVPCFFTHAVNKLDDRNTQLMLVKGMMMILWWSHDVLIVVDAGLMMVNDGEVNDDGFRCSGWCWFNDG